MIAASKRVSVVALTALCLGAAIPSAAQVPALSFKGIEFGKSTVEDVQSKFPGAKKYANAVNARPTGNEEFQLFRIGQTSAGTFWFTELDGKIEDLRATFTSESFPAVVAALREKYGIPTSTQTDQIKSKAGAAFSSDVVRWQLADGEIVVQQRSGRIDTMSLAIATTKILAKQADDAKKSVKDAAKDL